MSYQDVGGSFLYYIRNELLVVFTSAQFPNHLREFYKS